MGRERGRRPLEGRLGASGEHQDLRTRPRGRLRRGGRLLEDHVRVRPPDTEGAHPRAQRPAFPDPGCALSGHEERALCQLEPRVLAPEMEAGCQLAVLQHLHYLDEPSDPGRGVEVSDVRFYGPDGTGAATVGPRPEHLPESLDFDGIAEGGTRAMSLDVGDVLRS